MLRRKVTYRLYPKPVQETALLEQLRLHQQLYNALLQQRIEAYKRQHKTLTNAEQSREVTVLRRELEEYGKVNGHALQVTVKRVDLAFKAFFRRARAGERRAGFPRFKSLRTWLTVFAITRISKGGLTTTCPGFTESASTMGSRLRVPLETTLGELRFGGTASTASCRRSDEQAPSPRGHVRRPCARAPGKRSFGGRRPR